MSESVPSSTVSFAHRRSRNDSTVTFTYLGDDDLEWENEEVIVQDGERDIEDEYDETASYAGRLRSRSYSHISVEDPLLSRQESSHSLAEWKRSGGRVSQKIYIVSEDLTAVITGFRTSPGGFTLYMAVCILTLGLAYLILRWIPKWRIRLVGTQTPLGDCHWVAIEVSCSILKGEMRILIHIGPIWTISDPRNIQRKLRIPSFYRLRHCTARHPEP